MIMRRRLACCTRNIRDMSNDFDEQERMTTYNGLESCIHSFDNDSGTSRGDGCVTDFFDDDDSSCSSSTNAFGSFSSLWTIMKKDDQCQDEWKFTATLRPTLAKGKPHQFSDVETMKEKFAKLLLGEDVTGGKKGVSTALALSNAINSLAASVFGELWKLEPMPEERKSEWRREMDWLLAPTNYMVELVPTKQNDANGRTLEIMTPKARADIHVNLPALRKLDSMLIEMLDSMVNTEFWYAEVGSRAEGKSRSAGQSTRWWLPSPRVPTVGLSEIERKRLLHQGKLIFQVFKAAKAINESVLADMPIPATIRNALSKSGRVSLGEELYRILTAECLSTEDMISCLNLKSEHGALEAINRLEAAILVWKERVAEHGNGKSPIHTSWSFAKVELDKMESLTNRAELLLLQLKSKYPNLPQTFLDVTKIQYGKDVGHSILEAYSRVVSNLAFSILSRLGDILQEDITSNPNSPVAMSHLVGARVPGITDSPMLDRVRHSLIHRLNTVDVKKLCDSGSNISDVDTRRDEAKISSVSNVTPSRSRVWCIRSPQFVWSKFS
ncbi:rop guanine nucleotide exchange factor 14-like isoform X2 [Salvia hispanica]|uniref:rop guanine nucleotide exchange factor 14-like isoform X2 n=1 Tax=Salvia hispanica TaxID=49212 RepID=UPI002008F92A|nr:rop guanine nucleotide exchange factor 14-like isoform X2 [Salvia hispanica]XP_047968497.1 rop guanine nucleotide exchange factor 14-like isoform X2 [Salvia hispanica]XP_047968498.1 rop guanine nucleotide exchange factor 14-like isoform X2 [Salvia hispanica]XP_047968499.1 rop guanine nucleotide exchange factor 14-like isoform X2 [Salvia hispanica]